MILGGMKGRRDGVRRGDAPGVGRGLQDDDTRPKAPQAAHTAAKIGTGEIMIEKKEPSPHAAWESDEDVPAPPPPPRITKISIGFTKPKAPIKMTLGGQPKPATITKPAVASVFNTDDDDDEPEEMPAEAKMRMRNIGR
ncbi:hypothetical protein O3G_MSEX006968 [Manduca sexta]|uniref:PEST proteolytic signal-containing nuclear protein n=1 Tax=Manduca sexta TaxID=7130 RepID=A0A921Z5A5_MANSE|nr:hypothetical protein O3G_MSEX006968 [Manduca sexta]